MFQKTDEAVVIRTDFGNQQAWETICGLISAPVHDGNETFYAHVEFVENRKYRNFSIAELLEAVPRDYKRSFLFVVDEDAVSSSDFAILVVDLDESSGRSFRAIPTQIQGIENNLSIANMGFEEFAEAVDKDGVFRGFPRV